MGKLNYEPHIKHFSHEHPMELINIPSPQSPQNMTKAKTCSGCKQKASPGQWIYTCKSCNFNLHIPCSQMPKVINHPSDPNHPLVLLPSPAYPCGSFNCDGCGRQKNTGFSYHCTACSLDLHILCAAKPLSVNHHAHLAHPLTLTFYPPYETNGFSCDICHKLGMNHWLYRCASCGFDAHIGCADNPNNQRALVQQPQPQPLLQHHYSFPGATHQPQVMPQGVVHQGIPMINNNVVQPPQQQRLYHANSSPNMGVAQQMMMSTQQTYSQQPQQQLQQMQLQPQQMQQQLQQQMQQQLQQMQLQPQQQLQQQLQQMQLQPQPQQMQQQLQQQMQLQPQQQMQLQPQQQLQLQLQLQQQQLQQQQQQQNTNDVMNMAVQGMIDGASQQLGQSLMENALGGGNNDGGGGDSSSSLLNIGSLDFYEYDCL